MKISQLLLCLSLLGPVVAHSQEAPEPYGALPSARQLRWHEMELYTLIHFTPTTFQNKEWGLGDAEPTLFNPLHFDADQIAAAAAAGGFKGLISVAKHHDGFCLWPTQTTTYSIAQSPWKSGKGDMVMDFKEAADRHNLLFGVYLSAWDRNDNRYGTAAYADAYREQLRELMSNYGPLFTSWHDGANGGDGYYGGKYEKRTIDRSTYYGWFDKTWPIVRQLQPEAMIFSDLGPDMRWVGNEHGFAAETSWATLTPKGLDGAVPMPGLVDASNLPSGDRGGQYWIPAECDVPQRPGWFYHADQNNRVKTPNQLFEIYLKSVGRGGAMNLGLAPMPSGILHAHDVQSLKGFGEKVAATFAVNYADGAQVTASNVRAGSALFSPAQVLDADRYSYYASDDAVLDPHLVITLQGEQTFDIIRLRENIKLGQRLDSVVVEVEKSGSWQRLASATSIGANRLIKLPTPQRAHKLRIRLYAPVAPTLSDLALFREAPSVFAFEQVAPETVSSRGIRIQGQKDYQSVLDGQGSTLWQTSLKRNQSLVFELPAATMLSGMGYLPRQDGQQRGVPTRYKVSLSKDGSNWVAVAEGEFANIKANPILQHIAFVQPQEARYIRFEALETLLSDGQFSAADVLFYTN